jgi:hypothetical protein
MPTLAIIQQYRGVSYMVIGIVVHIRNILKTHVLKKNVFIIAGDIFIH